MSSSNKHTYAYAIIPFFPRAPAAKSILECTPQPVYTDFVQAVQAATAVAQAYNHTWNTFTSDYVRQRLGADAYDPHTLEMQAVASARKKNITHLVSHLSDDSKYECMEHGNVLVFGDESSERQAQRRQNLIRCVVFLMFFIASYGYYLINYEQTAVFTLLCGVNVSCFMLDNYIATPRQSREGLWITRVQIIGTTR
jgi:hypothetical protein